MKWQKYGKIAHIPRIRAQKQVFQSTDHNRAGRKGTNMFDAVLGDFHIKLSNFHKLDEPHLFIQCFSNLPTKPKILLFYDK